MRQEASPRDSVGILGASVRGPKHERDGVPNQDNWDGTTGSDYLIIAVADGLGSSSRAAKGSALATETAVEELNEWLTDGQTLRTASLETVRERFTTVFSEAREAVRELAASEQVSTDKFHTTLSVVAATSGCYAAGAVGDSGIVGVSAEECFKLVEREDSEYGHVTTSILSDKPVVLENFRFDYAERSLRLVTAFSDGLDEFAWMPTERSTPRAAFFDELREFTSSAETFDGEAQAAFTEFVDSDHFHTYSSDDKTLALGRVPDPDTSNSDRETVTEASSSRRRVTYADADFVSAVAEQEDTTTTDVHEVVGCSHSTALRRLHALEDSGRLESEKAGQAYEWHVATDGEQSST